MKNKSISSRFIALLTLLLALGGPISSVSADNSPLCFTARNGSVTVRFEIKNVTHTIQYSTNGTSWSTYTSNTNVTISANQSIYFRAASNQTVAMAFGAGSVSNCSRFYFTSSNGGKVEGSGNIMSLYGSNCLNLPLQPNAFASLFYNCTSLITTPSLPATTLAESCYNSMFEGCTSLTTAPSLPATSIASCCYYLMFHNCTSLTTAPSLPAATLAESCYNSMFKGCTSLTTAPSLPAITLTDYCYRFMFYGCTSLTTAPLLPATTLATACYLNMFQDCTSLTTAPSLPATTLTNYCYYRMFYGCTSLIVNRVSPGKQWIIPASTTATYSLDGMFAGTGGTMNNTPSVGVTYYILDQYVISTASNDSTMGYVTGGGTYREGNTISLTATSNAHYHFVRWSDGDTNRVRTVTVTDNETYTAIFAIDQYRVTLNGSHVTTTGSGTYGWGSRVIITAVPDSNYHFVCWSDSNCNATRTITVNCDTTMTAIVEANPYTLTIVATNGSVSGGGTYPYNSSVTLTAISNAHYHFVSWSDGDTNRVRTVTVTGNATYTANFAIDQHTVSLSGSHVTTTGSGTYGWGTQVTITAVPDANYHFVCWSDSNDNATHTITVNNDIALTAFVVAIHTLTTAGANGTVSGGGTYPYNSTVTLTAIPNDHYHFVNWSDGDTSRVRTVTVTGDATYTANFAIDQYTVSLSGSHVTTTGSGTYGWGSQVTITAVPDANYHFVCWSDSNTNATRTITVNGDTALTAIVEGNPFTLTIIGPNGTVSGSGTYPYNSTVTMTATPNEHYHFLYWTDGDTSRVRTVRVTGNKSYVAVFVIDQHSVTLPAENGTVTGAGTYNYGTEIQITATPNEHYHFVQWADSVTTPTRTIVVTQDTMLTAIFEGDDYVVSASTTNGTVIGAGTFPYGTNVSVIVVPDAHYRFVSWSDGNTDNPRSFVLTQDTTLTAITDLTQHNVTVVTNNATVTGDSVYAYNSVAQVTVTPDEHYVFMQWSDGVTTSTRNITVTSDTTLYAIVILQTHNVAVTTVHGTVAGGGQYGYNTQVTLQATPNDHYHFLHWNDGDISNPRTFAILQDTSFVAVMGIDSFQVASYALHGTTLGTGTYPYNQTVKLTAVPDDHYHFTQWSDGVTDNPRSVVVSNDTSFTPIMAIDMHDVTVMAVNGSVTGGGTYAYNTQVVLQAMPADHYHFVSWSDGDTTNPRTFNLTHDTTFTAVMAIDRHTVSATGDHVTITGTGEYDYGTTITLTAVADDHCTFVSWSDGNTDNPRQMVVTDDIALTAIATVDQIQLTVTAYNGTVTGSGSYDYGTAVTLTVVPDQGYMLYQWLDGNTSNPRTVMLTADTLLIATCKKFYEVKVSSSNEYTVTGAGTYFDGDIAVLEVTSLDENRVFSHWSDYNTDNPRSIVVNSDISLAVVMKDKPTPVENIAEDAVRFILTPNPVGKSEMVTIYGETEENCTVTILDAAGNVVGVYGVDALPFEVVAPSVDGTYFIRIESASQNTILKLIVK